MDIETVTTIFRRNMAQLASESVARRRPNAAHPVTRRAVRVI